jgi:propanol-preferring alcohol dehydrogenase
MILKGVSHFTQGHRPLEWVEVPIPEPSAGQILIRVSACGVCHTELDEIEGRTPPPRYPVIPGHQVVGRVVAVGSDADGYQSGDRVGIGWIYSCCDRCRFCLDGRENLCPSFMATGRDVDGGYAEYMVVPAGSAYGLPETLSNTEAAPLLCAGAIGYRALNLTGIENGQHLGLTGFGASAHLILKMARYRYPDTPVFVFARSEKERIFARELGAEWAGDTKDAAPERLQAIIDTTPAWRPVVEAMRNLESGGRLVINAIRKQETDKESLHALDYARHLWMEKEIKSVANITRRDIMTFLKLAAEMRLRPHIREFPLSEANHALSELHAGHMRGAIVLRME